MGRERRRSPIQTQRQALTTHSTILGVKIPPRYRARPRNGLIYWLQTVCRPRSSVQGLNIAGTMKWQTLVMKARVAGPRKLGLIVRAGYSTDR